MQFGLKITNSPISLGEFIIKVDFCFIFLVFYDMKIPCLKYHISAYLFNRHVQLDEVSEVVYLLMEPIEDCFLVVIRMLFEKEVFYCLSCNVPSVGVFVIQRLPTFVIFVIPAAI